MSADQGAATGDRYRLLASASNDSIGPDEREERLIEHFARAMHNLTCGDWRAAGFETKQGFRAAAVEAVISLNKQGHDLLDVLPKGARGG